MNAKSKPISGAVRLAQLLLLTATGLAAYLAYQALTGSQVAGCGPEEGCGKVLSSKWSSVLSIPISLPGLVMYLTLLLVTQFTKLKGKVGGFLAAFLSLSIILGALWFTALQMFIIKSYCAYCCTTHLLASLAALIILACVFMKERVKKEKKVKEVTVAPRNTGSKKQREKLAKQKAKQQEKEGVIAPDTTEVAMEHTHRNSSTGIVFPALLSILAVGATIALQAVGPEKDRSESVTSPSLDENGKEILIKDRVLITPYKISPTTKHLIAYDGGTTYVESGGLEELIIGNKQSEAEAVHLTYLFDWTCDHCRGLHQRLNEMSLEENALSLEDQFKITLLPGFYDAKSEAVHRIMLTAQIKDKVLFKELELGLYDGTIEPSSTAIMQEISKRVPSPVWQKAVSNYKPRVDRAIELAQMQTAHNEEKLGISLFPQLTSLTSIISGVPSDKGLKKFFIDASEEQETFLARKDTGIAKAKYLTSQNKSNVRRSTVNPPKRNNSVIEFLSTSVDGEPIQAGEISSGTFTFKNTGTDPLTIYNLKTSCGCTYSKGWKQTVEPGGTGQFSINYNSKGKSPYGIHNRNVWVTSSAKNHDESTHGKTYGNQVTLVVPIVDAEGNSLVRGIDGKPVVKVEDKPAENPPSANPSTGTDK